MIDEKSIISGILCSKSTTLWDRVVEIDSDVFEEDLTIVHAAVTTLYKKYRECPEEKYVAQFIKGEVSDQVSLKRILKLYLLLKRKNFTLKEWHLDDFEENLKERHIISVATAALTSLQDSVQYKGKLYSGRKGAEQLLSYAISDSGGETLDKNPFEVYERRKTRSGYLKMDLIPSLLDGFYQSEAWVIAGYAGEGKTTLLLNMLNNLRENGYRTLILGLERPAYEMRWRLASISSAADKIKIPYSKIKRAKLSAVEEKELSKKLISQDGLCEFIDAQVGMGPEKIYNLLRSKFYRSYYDIILVDYSGLCAKRGNNYISSLNEVLRKFKEIARLFSTVSLVLHQANREGWKEAQRVGRYTLAALADANEAERSYDGIMWILKTEFLRNRVGMLKYRDEAKNMERTVELALDPETYKYTVEEGSSVDSINDLGTPTWDQELPI